MIRINVSHKITSLGEILTEPQIEAVLDIIQKYPDSIERVKQMKAYLSPFKAELEKKGVVADYLAYVIEYLVSACPQDYGRN